MSNQNPPSPVSASPATKAPAGRHWIRWSLITLVVLAGCYAVFVRPFLKPAAPARGAFDSRPMPVTAEPARKSVLNVRLIALGTVTPVSTVTVRSRVDGELQKILFEEGQTVEAGATLAEIDPRPFEVQKLQGEAQLAKDNALLENARLDLDRFQTLLEQDSVAKQQVDTQAALVRQYEAAIKLDQAQVQSAELQLTYAHISSPIAGRIGLRLVDQGNIVHASDSTGIAVITQLQPITVLFSIPQDSVPQVMRHFKAGETMTVETYDREGRTLLARGRLVTVDNQIDPTTGTVKLRAEFPNTDETLFPNQFVNVQLLVDQLQGVTVAPAAAVQRGTVGTFVYLVADQKTVSVRPVETGPSDKGMIVITKGLVPGDVVVVDGVDKLHAGSQVELISRASETPATDDNAPKRDHTGRRKHDGTAPAQN